VSSEQGFYKTMSNNIYMLILVMIFGSFVFADDTVELVTEGNKNFREGKYSQALKKYESAEKNIENEDAVILFNKGAAEFGIRRFDKAAQLFEKSSLLSKDKKLQALALYNMALSSYSESAKDKKLKPEERIKALGEISSLFRKSFQKDKRLKNAAANLEIVNNQISQIKKQLEEQNRQQQKQQQERKKMQDKAKEQLEKQKKLNKKTSQRKKEEKNKEKSEQKTSDLSEKQKELQKQSKETSDEMKSSPDKQQQSASEDMKKAEQHQKHAKEKLDKKDFKEAEKEQERAVSELEKAVEKLSEKEKKDGKEQQEKNQKGKGGQKKNSQPLDKKPEDSGDKSSFFPAAVSAADDSALQAAF